MKPRPPLPPGPFLVVGLGRSGLAAALALRARGEEVIGCDAGSREEPHLREASERLSEEGVEVRLDASGDALAARAGTLIKSPGVPTDAPAVVAARKRRLPVLGELELAWRLLPNEFLAVTGTNGKTTTTEWIGHIHRQAGAPAAVAGNVGTALSSLVGKVGSEPTIVCEVSSFQLEDAEAFAPEAAVLINLSPDHLDRHESFEAYVQAKLRIFQKQTSDDVAVVPEPLRGFLGQLALVPSDWPAQQVEFGEGPHAALRDHREQLWWRGEPLTSAKNLSLRGAHNRQNAMAAAAVCLARGLETGAVVAGLKSFPGVAHRLELVATHDGVSYVNDSKATNVQSTLVALGIYEGGVHLIAGGRSKHQDFTPLAPLVADRCRAVYLIGEAKDELAAALERTAVPLRRVGDLERAMHAAHDAAAPGEVVLLSPACASYDAYRNFEARGDHFRALVEAE
ncbi:MAG: UDP-N-acetylmuramoyl-L-alanine--D-glutamate ligase [Solirubrobacteraceae bacterium]